MAESIDSVVAPVTAPDAPAVVKPQTFDEMNNMSDEQLKTLEAPQKEDKKKVLDPDVDEEDFGDDEELEDEGDDDNEVPGEEADADEEEETEDKGADDDEVFLEQKVNGKVQKFTEKQVRALISSGAHTLQVANEIKSQLDTREQKLVEVAQQVEKANGDLAPAWEALKKRDLNTCVLELAKKANISTLDVRRSLVNQVFPVVCQRLGLPKEWVDKRLQDMRAENSTLDVREENEFLAGERTRLEEASKPRAKAAEEQARDSLFNLQVQHGVSHGERNEAIRFIESVKGTDAKVTPEYIIEVALMQRTVNKGIDAIRAVRPQLAEDQKFVDFVVAKVKKNPDWTNSKIARWVESKARERAATQKEQEVSDLRKDISRKALKHRPKSRFESPNAGQQKPMRFEDIDPEDFKGLP